MKTFPFLCVFFLLFYGVGSWGSTWEFRPDGSDTPLDISGTTAHTNSAYYKEKAERLEREITALGEQITEKQALLERTRRSCSSTDTIDCQQTITALQAEISQLNTQKTRKTAEKNQAQENQSLMERYEQAQQEVEDTLKDQQTAAKKKAKKQKNLLYLTAGLNAAAAAAFWKKYKACMAACAPPGGCSTASCTPYKVLAIAAGAQAGVTFLQAGKVGKAEDQFTGIGPGVFIPSPDACQTYPDVCNSENFCQTHPQACCNPLTDSACSTDCLSGQVRNTMGQCCDPQTDTNCLAEPCPSGLTRNMMDECVQCDPQTSPQNCLTSCPENQQREGQQCVAMPGPCLNGLQPGADGQCTHTVNIPEGGFTGIDSNNPELTVVGEDGGTFSPAAPPVGSFSMNDPKIKKVLGDVKKQYGPLHDQVEALSEELGMGADSGDVGNLADSGIGGDSLFDGKNPGKLAAASFTGGSEIDGGTDDEDGGFGKSSPYDNLTRQFNHRRGLSQDPLGNKAMTLGEDKIGVMEDNIFLMVKRSYDKHRKDDQFIEGKDKQSWPVGLSKGTK